MLTIGNIPCWCLFRLWWMLSLCQCSSQGPVFSALILDRLGDKIAPVECSSNQSVHHSQVEMVLDRPNGLFPIRRERNGLEEALQKIYNRRTELNCDSEFRKIRSVQFLQMTNQKETVMVQDRDHLDWIDAVGDGNGDSSWERRPTWRPRPTNETETSSWNRATWFPRPLTKSSSITAATSKQGAYDDVNATGGIELVSLVFNVVGTCRGCPLANSGSYQLFDDAFRRTLQQLQGGGGGGEVNSLLLNPSLDKADCVCYFGLQPLQPTAPKVRDLIEHINERLEAFRNGTGLFNRTRLQSLWQLNTHRNETMAGGAGRLWDHKNVSDNGLETTVSSAIGKLLAAEDSSATASSPFQLLWAVATGTGIFFLLK